MKGITIIILAVLGVAYFALHFVFPSMWFLTGALALFNIVLLMITGQFSKKDAEINAIFEESLRRQRVRKAIQSHKIK